MKAPDLFAAVLISFLEAYARNVPEHAAEFLTWAERIRTWSLGPTASAGPDKPPPPPPPR